jgi:NADPH-dependent glutamate synthase beta subunit-like oxidoreductase/CO/xanthine dehydrogenase FAD-binding subunit
MEMKSFKHVTATSVEQAAAEASAAAGKAAFIAGGTDLLGVLKDHIHDRYPETVVDLKSIAGLSYVNEDNKGVRIGALTTLSEIAAHKAIREKYGALAEAARTVASPQIRNMATIGGNICQEPRCWYYRTPEDRFHCLRKGGNHCGALLGENRYHSLFGAVRVSVPSCSAACPGQVAIPDYLAVIRKGDLARAAKILLENNPMPAMTGRVCPHFCESECNRHGHDEPVSIRSIERSMGDYVLENANKVMKPGKSQGKKPVAIVGAGPAGLAAAYYLRKSGREVTVFDKMPEAGGMLAYGIPAYRLPKDIVRKQMRAFEGMGIKFKLGTKVGSRGFTLRDLRKSFPAVFIATGTWWQKTLDIDKSELLTSSMEFLLSIAQGRREPPKGRVLIIGGGNVAVDVAVSVLRLGTKDVTMACLEARDAMPAFPEDLAEALEEGVKLMPSWGPHRLLESAGTVTGMELVRCTSVFDEQGRFRPSFDPSETQTVDADEIILAIGQSADLSFADASLKRERGLIAIDHETQTASLDGVFAGGDVTSGPASVIEAIAAGRKAAQNIESYLSGGKTTEVPPARKTVASLLQMHPDSQRKSVRVKPPALAIPERGIDIEDRLTLSESVIRTEAQRCSNCGCVAVSASDIAPALIALGAKIKTNKRSVPAERFFSVAPMKTTALDADELVKEVEIPAPPKESKQGYLKHRIRNAIDFPIVSVASVLSSEGDKLMNVRIVLGAVAPIPLRAREVEAFLEGKSANEEIAARAGELAVKAIQPLAKNAYKAQVVRGLIKKAILGWR